MSTIFQRFKRAWNVFTNRSPTTEDLIYGGGAYYRPDRFRLRYGNDRTTIAAIYNQISIDCMNIDVKHVRTDQNGRYKEEIKDGLDNCLTIDANVDQTGRAFVQDLVLSLLDEGCVAVVPVDTTSNLDGAFDVLSLRVGKIVQWYPAAVRVELYNEQTGRKQEVTVPKSSTAIIQNPLYSVMNEPNGTARRLARKLALLDNVDENDYGKLDLIIQLPYVIKSATRKEQAEARRKDIEMQLSGSRYGVAYTDGTEHITQLNRSLDNHLLDQIKTLKDELYSQLGLSPDVFAGTANEQTMLNYWNRTIEPIMSAIVEEMTRKFLSKKARTQGQLIMYFRDPFKLVPVNNIADIVDKFSRNEVLSSNELRGIIGFKPVDNPDADALRNKNLNQTPGQENPIVTDEDTENKASPEAEQWVKQNLN